ncbi:MAG: XTP/dITP diphosphatase [Euryarchaeota archaeon]|nr:XTP/dITP diphosphatase [Euryarchaeota archaeon]
MGPLDLRPGSRLAFVTTNPGKFKEAGRALRPLLRLEWVEMGYPELQADDLETVARFGARYAAGLVGRPVMVEDSGLFIEALRGFPGVYSAYVFRTLGNPGVLRLLDGEKNRRAVFRSAVALCAPKGEPLVFRGECRGRIAREGRGRGGFGYDPIFQAGKKAFAEMATAEKNEVSHRGRALRALAAWVVRQQKRSGRASPPARARAGR